MSERPSRLFDEFAARYARGEQPDALEYLERAGDQADELAGVLEVFLAAGGTPEPSEEATRLFSAWVESAVGRQRSNPLAILRKRSRLSQKSIVSSLCERFSFEPSKRRKVTHYYAELEAGLLEPRRIDKRLIDLLSEIFKINAADLLTLHNPPALAETRLMQSSPTRSKITSAEPGSPEWDDVDQLFRGAML